MMETLLHGLFIDKSETLMLNNQAIAPVSLRSWFSDTIENFRVTSSDQLLAKLVTCSTFPVLQTQRDAWLMEFSLLRDALAGRRGKVYLEFEVPRIGHRIDAVVLLNGIIVSIEFKIDS